MLVNMWCVRKLHVPLQRCSVQQSNYHDNSVTDFFSDVVYLSEVHYNTMKNYHRCSDFPASVFKRLRKDCEKLLL